MGPSGHAEVLGKWDCYKKLWTPAKVAAKVANFFIITNYAPDAAGKRFPQG